MSQRDLDNLDVPGLVAELGKRFAVAPERLLFAVESARLRHVGSHDEPAQQALRRVVAAAGDTPEGDEHTAAVLLDLLVTAVGLGSDATKRMALLAWALLLRARPASELARRTAHMLRRGDEEVHERLWERMAQVAYGDLRTPGVVVAHDEVAESRTDMPPLRTISLMPATLGRMLEFERTARVDGSAVADEQLLSEIRDRMQRPVFVPPLDLRSLSLFATGSFDALEQAAARVAPEPVDEAARFAARIDTSPTAKVPPRRELVPLVLLALRELGGEGFRQEIVERMLEIGGFTEGQRSVPPPPSQVGRFPSKLHVEIAWAIHLASRAGEIERVAYARWRLLDR